MGRRWNSALIQVSAKEVEATREWTLLGENDTIPAGLHVRMDLETGQKWVKLMDDDDEKNIVDKKENVWKETRGSHSLATTTAKNEEESKPTKRKGVKVTHLSEADIQAAGTSKVTEALNRKSNTVDDEKRKANFARSVASLNDHVSSDDEEENEHDIVFADGYNFKKMHQTFSKLPKEEQERMGGIPSLPDPEKVSLEELQIFKDRMTSIWLQRQMELKKVEDELVVDLPKVIQERIIFLKDYLENPYHHLYQLLANNKKNNDQNGANSLNKPEVEADDEDEENNAKINDILAVLLDLEYHMADIDMARDFHIMGGWPLLVSLISDSVHDTSIRVMSNTYNGTESTDTQNDNFRQEVQPLIWEIQSAAAWAIGTAVKNTEEFYLWALEDFSNSIVNGATEAENVNEDVPKHPITVISLLLSSSFLPPYTSINNIDSPTFVKKQQKALYALSALLRGNRLALRHFYMIDGPSILDKYLSNAIFGGNIDINDDSQKIALSKAGIKFASKVLALTRDLITDIKVHPDGGDNDSRTTIADIDEDIIKSFTTESWCNASLQLMKSSVEATSISIHENVLNSVNFMKPYCDYTSAIDLSHTANLFIDSWNKDEFIDEDYKKDLTQLVESILTK